jgi:hypothetical protein
MKHKPDTAQTTEEDLFRQYEDQVQSIDRRTFSKTITTLIEKEYLSKENGILKYVP